MKYSASSLASLLAGWQEGPGAAHQRLSDCLQVAILDGRLAVGAALPSERSLAPELHVSRITVATAYRALATRGFLHTSERHRGTVTLPPSPLPALVPPAAGSLDLRAASPRAPGPVVHRAYSQALELLPRYLQQTGYDRVGLFELRSAVAQWFTRRGLRTLPEQILITHGSQHALSLIAGALLEPHARVVVEHPAYPNALRLLQTLGARLHTAPLVHDLADHDELAHLVATSRLAYLAPDFHNPTGHVMPTWAREKPMAGARLVIDETMVELGLDGVPLPSSPPMALFHPDAITIGSLSKSVWGGLRVGWLRAPKADVRALARRRPVSDLGNAVVDQLAAAVLLHDAQTQDPDRSWERTRACDGLRAGLAAAIPELHIDRPGGGLALWVQLPQPVATHVVATAARSGLRLSAGPSFSPTGAFRRHLRIPFTHDPETVEAIPARLAGVLRTVLARKS